MYTKDVLYACMMLTSHLGCPAPIGMCDTHPATADSLALFLGCSPGAATLVLLKLKSEGLVVDRETYRWLPEGGYEVSQAGFDELAREFELVPDHFPLTKPAMDLALASHGRNRAN